MPPIVLVVDDDRNILEVLQTRLETHQFTVRTASGGEEALAALRAESIDAVVTDLRMPGMDGLELLGRMRSIDSTVPIIFLTAHGSIAEAVRAMKLGAYDFLLKPYNGSDLVTLLRRALAHEASPPTTGPSEAELILGRTPAMRRLADLIERAAPTPTSVLVTGESGTGKELVARTLHRKSARASAPFVIIDCGALSDTLLESELFGHRKGSFTSATQDKKGLLEEADGGTVFLDEIGNISVPMQTRLLRFLQNGEIRRIGDLSPRIVDVRVIAATNRDLSNDTSSGRFREDLFYRLKVVTIQVPPLRDRRDIIPELALHFLRDAALTLRRPASCLDDAALARLRAHSWPGNVRQLKHVIEAAVALSRNELLTPEDLERADFSAETEDEAAPTELTALERMERSQILRALREHGWVQKRAADSLGISGRVIHYKIRKYAIRIPRT